MGVVLENTQSGQERLLRFFGDGTLRYYATPVPVGRYRIIAAVFLESRKRIDLVHAPDLPPEVLAPFQVRRGTAVYVGDYASAAHETLIPGHFKLEFRGLRYDRARFERATRSLVTAYPEFNGYRFYTVMEAR